MASWDNDPIAAPWESDPIAQPQQPAYVRPGPLDMFKGLSQPELPHKGWRATVNAAMSGQIPVTHETPQSFAQTGQQYTDIAKGATEAAGTLGLGLPGDMLNTGIGAYNLASTGLNAIGGPNLGQIGPGFLPTTQSLTDKLSATIGGSGDQPNQYEAFGRFLGAPVGMKAGSNLAGDIIGAVRNGLSRSITGSGPTQAAQKAQQAGYVVPPTMASDEPGAVSNVLSGVSGKIKLQQAASAKNQELTNALAARSVGLPEDQPITEAALEGVRDQAGQAYEAVRQAPIQIIPDAQFSKDIGSLKGATANAHAAMPSIMGNSDIDALMKDLNNVGQLSPNDAVDVVRTLRYQAQQNLKNFAAPKQMDLGRAQSAAANALEGLLDRNLTAATGNNSSLINDLQNARRTIAQTYTVQKALNPSTGTVDAAVFGRELKKGAPLTGEQRTIGETALAFPKATQNLAKVGGHERLSVLDMMAALGTHGKTLGLSLARPAARSVVLSPTYQRLLVSPPMGYPDLGVDLPTAFGLSLPNALLEKKPLDYSQPAAR